MEKRADGEERQRESSRLTTKQNRFDLQKLYLPRTRTCMKDVKFHLRSGEAPEAERSLMRVSQSLLAVRFKCRAADRRSCSSTELEC